jgi:hypothetical protein
VYLVKIFVIRMVRVLPIACVTECYDNSDSVIAAQSIANIVKSSLGPLGLDKMLVDNIGVRAAIGYIHAY